MSTQGGMGEASGLTVATGFVAQIGLRLCFPFPRMDLAYGHGTRYTVHGTRYTVHGTWYAKSGEAV
jgi:hypothetical protein